MSQWEEIHHTYRQYLEILSLTLHPFGIADSAPQTSAQVHSQWQTALEAIAALAERHELLAQRAARQKVHTQRPSLAALVDFWWQGITRDLEPFRLSPI